MYNENVNYTHAVKEVLPYSNGSPWLYVTFQKSNSTLVGAVAFLMLFFLSGLYDTDCSNDDADNRHNNTYNAHYYF